MVTRDEFVKNVKTQLEEMNTEIEKIQHKAKMVKEEVKAKLQARVAVLQEKRDAATAKVQEVRYASEEAWTDLKVGTEQVVFSLKNAVKKTLAHFRKSKDKAVPDKIAE